MSTDAHQFMLVVDPGPGMAGGLDGIGLRAFELASAFGTAGPCAVHLLQPPPPEAGRVWPSVRVVTHNSSSPRAVDYLIYSYRSDPRMVEEQRSRGATCILDAIVWPLEFLTYEHVLARRPGPPALRDLLASYDRLLRLAHGYIVGSPEERVVLAALLASRGLLDPTEYFSDPLLASRITTLPVGFSEVNESFHEPTVHIQLPRFPFLVWNGGMWNHYTPEAGIAAIELLNAAGTEVGLLFMYPRSERPTAAYQRSLAAVAENSRLQDLVWFLDGRLSVINRAVILRQSSGILCTYRANMLSELSLPLRVRDSFLYRLPVVCPPYGALGRVVERESIGFTADSGWPASVANAILAALRHGDANALERMHSGNAYERQANSLLDAWSSLHDFT